MLRDNAPGSESRPLILIHPLESAPPRELRSAQHRDRIPADRGISSIPLPDRSDPVQKFRRVAFGVGFQSPHPRMYGAC